MASIKLSIAEPCHENWNAMLPEEKGRFCLSCQKTVVDFTAMSDRQVFDYFKNYKGDTCGQLSNDQLNRELTKPKTHSIGRWKYFWQILLPAFFAFQKLEAQPRLRGKVAATPICKPVQEKPPRQIMGLIMRQPPQQLSKPTNMIHGHIVNDKQEPVSFATIVSSNGTSTIVDSLGWFKMLLTEKESLSISCTGYHQKSFTLDSIETQNIAGLRFDKGAVVVETTIELKPEETLVDEVVVVAYGNVRKLDMIGGTISVITPKNMFKKQTTIAPITTPPQLKIFPNPIQAGQNFQLAIQVKKTGSYLLRIVDAAGKVVAEERLNVSTKDYTETINGSALRQPGVYFINISNNADKKGKALTGRVVVQ